MTQTRWMTRAGWIVTGLTCTFLLVDAGMKLAALLPVLEAGSTLGFPGAGINRVLGGVLLLSTLLALFPRTSFVGSILVTGYLGGAIATQLRIGAPLASHVLFGLYVGVALWLGLVLRNPTVRTLIWKPKS